MAKFGIGVLLGGCGALALPQAAVAQEGTNLPVATGATARDLTDLSIEELAQLNVRSAAKQDQPLSHAATSLFVITGEEILSSAALSIPEALRLAPNLQVQQVDARQYAITARGFNSRLTSNKLLVLLDGRTLYSPLASSVFWELHNRPVEEIEQIEVISGPGGTLHGPNAVNGVVNIVTRDARDTIGAMLRGTAGDREQTAAARFGMPIGEDGAVRVYGQWFHRDALAPEDAAVLSDRFAGWQTGFRSDFEGEAGHFTLQGDLFRTDTGGQPGDGDMGHNLLARWSRNLTARSSIRVQGYYDQIQRDFDGLHDSLQTFDLDVQYDHRAGVHDFVVGAGVRTTRDEFINSLDLFGLEPPRRRLWVFNAFAQDRVTLSDQWSLILGLKAERSSFTGTELLPNVRIAWQPNDRTLFWGAVSRAVRTPSRLDRELEAPPLLMAGAEFDTEKLIAIEAGYRGQPAEHSSLSISLFYNHYDDLRSIEPAPGTSSSFRLSNGWRGHSYGIEAWSSTRVADWWRVNLGLATLWKDFELKRGRIDVSGGDALGHDPEYQLMARSLMVLGPGLELNVGLRWIGRLEPLSGAGIGDYAEADGRLGYRLNDHVELFVSGRNLLRRAHFESDDSAAARPIRRSLHAGTRIVF